MAENIIDKIKVNGTEYEIQANSTASAQSINNATCYTRLSGETDAFHTVPSDKDHVGLEFTTSGYKGWIELGSTGNFTMESGTKHVNIEAAKSIQMKPGNKIILDSSRRIIAENKNKVDIEAKFDDYGDSTYTASSADEAWAQTCIAGRSLDLRCEEHGGVAVQPAGADSENFTNKIKFEHSMKVSVEHFGEYTVVDPSSMDVYDFVEGEWVCLPQPVVENQAFQLLGGKVLKSDNMTWNNAMENLDGTHCGMKYNGLLLAIGYASETGATEITNAGVNEESGDSLVGKYLYVKSLALTGVEFSSVASLKVERSSATTKVEYLESTAETATEIVAPAEGTKRTITSEGGVKKDGVEYAISGSQFTIEKITYHIDGDDKVYPIDDTTISYPISGGKFTITPSYKVHFKSEGGKGIEWGTFNPLHTSLYSADYRFKENAPVYAVSRGALEIKEAATDKTDYPTQADDFKDIIDETKQATWGEIVKVASDYAEGKVSNPHIVEDEDGNMDITLSGESQSISLNATKHIKLIATENVNIQAEKVKFDEKLGAGTVEALSGLSLGATPEVVMLETKISTKCALEQNAPVIKLGMQNNYEATVYYDTTEKKVHLPYDFVDYYVEGGNVYDPSTMTAETAAYVDSACTIAIPDSDNNFIKASGDGNTWIVKSEDGKFKKVKSDKPENHGIVNTVAGYENIVFEDAEYTSETFTKLEPGQMIATKTISLTKVAALAEKADELLALLDK